MAGIADYSTTAGSNTAVGGVSIAEGMAPGNVNNAIRALMADLATFYAEAYRMGNIRGTVSESGGTPTGPILENGANANGTYLKFASGEILMWSSARTFTRASTARAENTWTLPVAAITDQPVIVSLASLSTDTGDYTGTITVNSIGALGHANGAGITTSTTLTLYRINGATDWASGNTISNAYVTAKARWF